MSNLLFQIFIFLTFPLAAKAYPDFMGYGYRSCLTCHYNGAGGGPLNDYGRALFANTIAARSFVDKSVEEEELARRSQFFNDGPWWFKPGFKARILGFVVNPGKETQVERVILMQADLSSAVFFDRDENLGFIGTVGYIPRPTRLQQSNEEFKEVISREHYFRYHSSEHLWFYFGLTDKVYGLRTNDHVTFARQKVGLTQNDQTHGLITHYVDDDKDVFIHLFAGNLTQDEKLRQKGMSIMYEKALDEKRAIGVSALGSANKYVSWGRTGIHLKQGFNEGTSFIAEAGLIQNQLLTGAKTIKLGSYFLTQSLVNVWRGYNLFLQLEHYNEEFKPESPDIYRLSGGFLVFPMQKTEVRLIAQHQRGLSQQDFVEDAWNIQGQLHVSY